MKKVTRSGQSAVAIASLAIIVGLAIRWSSRNEGVIDEHADLRASATADATARCIMDLVLAREVKFDHGKWTILNSQELRDLLMTNRLNQNFVNLFGFGDRKKGFFNSLGNPYEAAISNGLGEIRVVVKSRGSQSIVEAEQNRVWSDQR